MRRIREPLRQPQTVPQQIVVQCQAQPLGVPGLTDPSEHRQPPAQGGKCTGALSAFPITIISNSARRFTPLLASLARIRHLLLIFSIPEYANKTHTSRLPVSNLTRPRCPIKQVFNFQLCQFAIENPELIHQAIFEPAIAEPLPNGQRVNLDQIALIVRASPFDVIDRLREAVANNFHGFEFTVDIDSQPRGTTRTVISDRDLLPLISRQLTLRADADRMPGQK